MVIFSPCNQWPFQFQEPFYWRYLPFIRLFFSPKFQGISPQNMAQNMVLTYLHFRIHWLKVGFPTSPEALGHVPDFAGDAGRCYMAMVGKPKHAIGSVKGKYGKHVGTILKKIGKHGNIWEKHENIWENPLSMEVLMGKNIELNGWFSVIITTLAYRRVYMWWDYSGHHLVEFKWI